MKCAHCMGLGYNSLLGLSGRVKICDTCNGLGEVRPPFTIAYDPKKNLVEHYDRPVR